MATGYRFSMILRMGPFTRACQADMEVHRAILLAEDALACTGLLTDKELPSAALHLSSEDTSERRSSVSGESGIQDKVLMPHAESEITTQICGTRNTPDFQVQAIA